MVRNFDLQENHPVLELYNAPVSYVRLFIEDSSSSPFFHSLAEFSADAVNSLVSDHGAFDGSHGMITKRGGLSLIPPTL